LDTFVIILTKIISFFTGLLGGGTNLPGEIALKLSPNILKTVTKDYKIIMITGTNGKTTTAGMLCSILRSKGVRVVNNESGANLKPGIVSCLIKGYSFFEKKDLTYAVLEVDEAYAKRITSDISPDVFAVTNIFRDQLDRYGEVDKTLKLIEEACEQAPGATLVLNGDEAMLNNFLPQNKHLYYGFRVPIDNMAKNEINAEGKFCKNCHAPYSFEFITFNHLGNYACPSCGMRRPRLDLGIDNVLEVTTESSEIIIDGLSIKVNQPGSYNIYNALAAAACAKALEIDDEFIKIGIENQGSKFGRQETINIDSREVRIILVKNPAGCNEAINSIMPDTSAVNLSFLLNDKHADGTDVSWIYDVDFEKFAMLNYQNVLVGGIRCYDAATRLKCAWLDTSKFLICEDYDTLLYNIKTKCTGRIYMLATYTAMVNFRKYLHKKKYIKKLWY